MLPDRWQGILSMNSSRPYLVRAIHEWIVDNGLTPHLLVNATLPGNQVPTQFIEDGRIVLNLSSTAVHGLVLGNDMVTFSARFSGKPFQVCVPVNAVIALYARENGKGMVFPEEHVSATSAKSVMQDEPGPDDPRKPVLTVIK